MNDQWAAENLKTIRTLMERAAVYRRALAPVMTVTGVLGLAAALGGWKAGITAPRPFVVFWLCVAIVTVGAGGLLIRRQALQQGEHFWSPPMRRVSQALLPGLVAGLMLGVLPVVLWGRDDRSAWGASPASLSQIVLPLSWVMLYGCAVHAAGFFMPRGVRLFGWVLIGMACLGLLISGFVGSEMAAADFGYGVMGSAFGLIHLIYGLYLFATEPRQPAG
jgi:hypothetical protein